MVTAEVAFSIVWPMFILFACRLSPVEMISRFYRACVALLSLALIILISTHYARSQNNDLRNQERTKQLVEAIELLSELKRIIEDKKSYIERGAKEVLNRMVNDSKWRDSSSFMKNLAEEDVDLRIFHTQAHFTEGEQALFQWIFDICKVRLVDENLDLKIENELRRIVEKSAGEHHRKSESSKSNPLVNGSTMIVDLMIERHTSTELKERSFLVKPEDTYDEVMMRLPQGKTDNLPESVLQWAILAVHSRAIKNLLGPSWRNEFEVTPMDTYETLCLKTRSLLELAKRHQEKVSSF